MLRLELGLELGLEANWNFGLRYLCCTGIFYFAFFFIQIPGFLGVNGIGRQIHFTLNKLFDGQQRSNYLTRSTKATGLLITAHTSVARKSSKTRTIIPAYGNTSIGL